MPVAKRTISAFGARAKRMRLVLFALAVFLCIASVSVEVAAQSAPPPTLTPWGGLDTLYARMVYARNQEIAARSASAAGVEVAASGSVSVMNGATMAGKVAINEIRVVPLARIAARMATSAAPVAIAMIAADLIGYGIKRCIESASGWCKPGQTNPSAGDTGFNGYRWCFAGGIGGNACGDSPDKACAASVAAGSDQSYTYVGLGAQVNPTFYRCVIKRGDTTYTAQSAVQQQQTCVTNYTVQAGVCKPDPNANVPPQPITYPELSDKLAQALTGNPNRAKDYWGITPLDGWKDWLNESTTQAKPAEVTSPADGRVPGPRRSTTTSAGTTTTDTTYTVRPNTDAGTMKDAPVTVTTTVTTTHPDGTTETTTTNAQPVPDRGGGGTKVEVKSCGLADTAPCKIDETGTPTYQEPSVAKSKMDDADSKLKTKLDDIGQAKPDQFGIGDVVKPLQGSCSSFSYAVPKATGIESMDIDLCPTIDATRDVVTWLWIVVSAMVSILLVRDAINGA